MIEDENVGITQTQIDGMTWFVCRLLKLNQ